MLHKAMLAALLGLFLTGCAVYGDGPRYSGYDRHYYSNSHYRVQRYPVYVAPRHYYGDNRYQQHRYDVRHDVRRDQRVAQPHQGWNGKQNGRHKPPQRLSNLQQRAAQSNQRWDGRQGNQHRQPQGSSNQQQRDQGARGGERRGWETQRN